MTDTHTTDLVARLRDHAREFPQWDYGPVGGAMREAADAIERLKELADKFMWQVRDTCARAEAADARIAKLEKALSAAHYYIDASDRELSDAGMTREDALRAARITREALDEARAAALEEAAKVAEQKFRIDQNRRDRRLDEEWEQNRETAGDEIAAAIRALQEPTHD